MVGKGLTLVVNVSLRYQLVYMGCNGGRRCVKTSLSVFQPSCLAVNCSAAATPCCFPLLNRAVRLKIQSCCTGRRFCGWRLRSGPLWIIIVFECEAWTTDLHKPRRRNTERNSFFSHDGAAVRCYRCLNYSQHNYMKLNIYYVKPRVSREESRQNKTS